ncbi:MAG: hypothetical protein SWK76_15860 [Actinomycetota bacterium]|nr:hypothetical protein [Actinomycetota bacterium]
MHINNCELCRVPEYISTEHLWINSGLIAQKRDQRHVVVSRKSENLDPLFEGIERTPLATRHRAGRAYMDRLIPKGVRDLLQ